MTREAELRKEIEEIRPVRCFVCGKKMHYLGEKNYEPEYKIYDYAEQVGYVHQRCIRNPSKYQKAITEEKAKWQKAVQKLKEELPVFMKEKNGTSIWNIRLIIDKIFGGLAQ